MVTANFFLAADGETRSLAGRTFGNEKQARCARSASWPAPTGLIFMYRGGRALQLARSVVVKCIVFGYSPFHSLLFPPLLSSIPFLPSLGAARLEAAWNTRDGNAAENALDRDPTLAERSTRIILEFARNTTRIVNRSVFADSAARERNGERGW